MIKFNKIFLNRTRLKNLNIVKKVRKKENLK